MRCPFAIPLFFLLAISQACVPSKAPDRAEFRGQKNSPKVGDVSGSETQKENPSNESSSDALETEKSGPIDRGDEKSEDKSDPKSDPKPIPEPVKFKALTFNVWTAKPDAIARDVKKSGADLACLQEASVDETKEAAKLLGNEWVAVVPSDGSEYSFVARFPLVKSLGNTQIKRGAVGAIFRISNTYDAVFFCHHGDYPAFGPRDMALSQVSKETAIANDKKYREKQMKEILTFAEPYRKSDMPVFLMGDFNSASHLDYAPTIPWPITTMISSANFRDSWRDVHPDAERKAPGAFKKNDPGISWSRVNAKDIYARMDFIFYAGPVKPLESDTIDLESSDHIPVFTVFQLGGSLPFKP